MDLPAWGSSKRGGAGELCDLTVSSSSPPDSGVAAISSSSPPASGLRRGGRLFFLPSGLRCGGGLARHGRHAEPWSCHRAGTKLKNVIALAGGFAVSKPGAAADRPEFKGKITWYVWICGIITATSGLLFGYDIGISGKPSYLLRDWMDRSPDCCWLVVGGARSR